MAEVGFLPVEHTHEDIDQTFSCTSDRLRNHDAVTLRNLYSELRSTYNDHTEVAHMKHVLNWYVICNQEHCLSAARNFSISRYFRFRRLTALERSVTQIKTTCDMTDSVEEEWKPLINTGIDKGKGLINFAPDMNKTLYAVSLSPTGSGEVT